MAKMGIPLNGNSPLFDFPLAQCLVYFNGFLLGKTTSDTILKVDRDIKDILFSQDGTKAADWVCTGELYSMDLTFGETKDELLAVLDKSAVIDNDGNLFLNRDLYESYRDNRAGELKLIKVDGDGSPISGDTYVFNFYEAIPVVNGEILQFGADTQKNFQVTFNFGYKEFAAGESATRSGGYGYIGDPTVLDVPALEWPPVPQSMTITGVGATAASLAIVFDRDIEFPTGSYVSGGIEVIVNNGTPNVIAANTTILTTTVTVDLGTVGEAIAISPGDTVTVNILPDCLQGASDNVAFPFVTKFLTLNNVT
jgi:hypothetical protein